MGDAGRPPLCFPLPTPVLVQSAGRGARWPLRGERKGVCNVGAPAGQSDAPPFPSCAEANHVLYVTLYNSLEGSRWPVATDGTREAAKARCTGNTEIRQKRGHYTVGVQPSRSLERPSDDDVWGCAFFHQNIFQFAANCHGCQPHQFDAMLPKIDCVGSAFPRAQVRLPSVVNTRTRSQQLHDRHGPPFS
jgi:hypothetical protein